MKITRGRQPTDFGASNDDALKPDAPETSESATSAADPQATPPATGDAPVAASQTRIRRPSVAAKAPSAWPLYLAALVVAVLWALGPIAFAFGYRSGVAPLTDPRFAFTVFALLAVGPAVMVFAVAYFIRQGQLLALQTRRAQALEAELISPALRAAGGAEEVTQAVRMQIAAAAAAADAARETLSALRQQMAVDTETLTRAAQDSLAQAQQLSGELGRERGELEALGASLEAQAARTAELVDQQAQRVAQASQSAEAQMREAEAVLSARAEGLTAAAAQAGAAARTSGEDLARQIARLETAGQGVADQVRAVEGGLAEQRTALAGLAQALREDHQGFSDEADAHAVRLDDFIGQARAAAGEMSERATTAGDSLRGLIAEAAERFGELADLAGLERESLNAAAAQSLDGIGRAAADQRERMSAEHRETIAALTQAADDTREAAVRHAAAAREQVEQLSEAAFAAGQKANQVFEARLEEARALVEQSSKMVSEAGAVAATKLDEGAAAARETLAELTAMMAALEVRAQTLPAEAQAQVAAVQTQVASGMDALMAHARRTAQEAQTIDSAFQERVRRNFEMLSEAVRLMGAVAAAPTPVAPLAAAPAAVEPAVEPAMAAEPAAPTVVQAPEPAPFEPAYAPPKVRRLSSTSPPPAAAAPAEALPPQPAEPAPDAPSASGSALAERLGLRPRLKLTPTSKDEAFSAVFDPPAAKSALAAQDEADEEADAEDEPTGETWTWKDLLASLNGGEGATAEAEEQTLAAELRKMGIDPVALLPDARVEQIAAAMQVGDTDGARQVVKRLAGASSRRIVRRLFTDAPLKAEAETFVGRYRSLAEEAAARDPRGLRLFEVLGSDAGRIYLLLDQALGDAPAGDRA